MKNNIILQLILIVFLFVSCSEDWLQPDPLSFLAPENTYVDAAGFDAVLVRCKREIRQDHNGPFSNMVAETAFTDLATALRQSDFTKITPSTWGQFPVLNLFADAYVYIKNANTVITRIDDIKWTNESEKNRMLSEALWFRSYWYYRLVNSYGDVPWEGKEVTNIRLDYYTTSRWAILDQIQEDLEFAVENLPVKAARLGDVSKGAANHLLAKVCLANCNFDKAITAASAVIDGPYALMTEQFGSVGDAGIYYGNKAKADVKRNVMWDLHQAANKNNPANTETIYTSIDREGQVSDVYRDWRGSALLRNYTPSYWKVPDSKGARASNWNLPQGLEILGIGNGDVRTNNFWHYTIWEEGNFTWKTTPDLRRADCNWVEMGEIINRTAASPDFGQALTKAYYGNLADTMDTWFPWAHNKLYIKPSPDYDQPWGGHGDIYFFRLAETYLIRAEAYYFKDQLGLAAADINKVRGRAKATLIAASDVTIDYIFDERARELYAEEMRHGEMARVSFQFAKLNKKGYSLETIHTKNWYHDRVLRVNDHFQNPRFSFADDNITLNPEHMLWPIAQVVITGNTLGRINQNFGYDGFEFNVPALETIPKDKGK